ncbi:MAG TPA: TetR/AcrR family transcriptional regulator [Streptosporangiaceae bacterium]|jgi:AcrR family transcriptional regulator|nr:TetR/AcrR family transcriptional regulator [Streptosporangiaceae bacterium]
MSVTGLPAEAKQARPMRADAQRNYARLLDAATAAFVEHGADDVSLEEIARRAGVGIGTLYRHFPTRQALLEAVYRDQVESLNARAEQLRDTESPGDALADWMRALVRFSSTKRSMTSALLATLGTNSELLSSCSQVICGAAESLLARAQQAGVVRPDADARDLIRLVHAVNIATEKAPDPGQADRMLALILDGLRPQPAAGGQPASEAAPGRSPG